MTKKDIMRLGWPMSLLHDAFNGIIPDLDKNIEANIEYSLSGLASNKRKIAILRYSEGLSMPAIAQKYGVTTERIRQITSQVLTCVRKHHRLFCVGIGMYEEEQREKERLKEEQYHDSISSLGIPGRVCHGLRLLNIHTVSELTQMTPDSLRNIHQVGPAGVDAVVKALAARGLKLRSYGFY